jgi:hypothetical protein
VLTCASIAAIIVGSFFRLQSSIDTDRALRLPRAITAKSSMRLSTSPDPSSLVIGKKDMKPVPGADITSANSLALTLTRIVTLAVEEAVLSKSKKVLLMSSYISDTIDYLKHSSPAQAEFYQAAEEVLNSLKPLLDCNPKYQKHNIIQRIVEPERQIFFRVAWIDDQGAVRNCSPPWLSGCQ